MAVSSIPNAPLANNPENQQKMGSATEQSGQKKSDLSSNPNGGENRYSDNVNISQQAGKTSGTAVTESSKGAKALDAESAKELLNRTMQTYMADSKTAISTQAKVSPQAGQTLLTDS